MKSNFEKFVFKIRGGTKLLHKGTQGFDDARGLTTPLTKSNPRDPVGNLRIMEGIAFLFIGNEKYAYARG